ncbi:transmembrane protein 41B-like [Saccoglossus kowalevskii]|uniref:Transmembrane protein 41B-like n=1 Tax=Saccoglossus kowalevskii TaxID=10224 RepID=A0ABM0H0V7_SACKO|nr:PREDICTED: transmembrane protein 41B-like [Saccoglossus kowalevskii]
MSFSTGTDSNHTSEFHRFFAGCNVENLKRPPLPAWPRRMDAPSVNLRKRGNIDADHDEKQCNNYEYKDEGSTRSFILLALIFLSAVVIMSGVYWSFPKLESHEAEKIKLPQNIDDAKGLGQVLSLYKDKYYLTVLCGYFMTYIFLQTFAIPGSIFLSILSGFLFPFPLALFLVCLCSAIGATNCYLLFYLAGRNLVQKYIPEKVAEWAATVGRHRDHLLNYIIFLRITPFLPNWFINITSPVINVPLSPFFFGTFLGVAPPSFVAIQAGTTLHQLMTASDAVSWKSVIILAVLAALSLVPVLFKQKLKKKFE